jgi:hypothetical protein
MEFPRLRRHKLFMRVGNAEIAAIAYDHIDRCSYKLSNNAEPAAPAQ